MGEIVEPECNDPQSLFGTEVSVVGKTNTTRIDCLGRCGAQYLDPEWLF